jgi:lipopolysaccharide transport system permease protein
LSEPDYKRTTLIAPHRGLAGLNFSELWAHRELLYFLTWRDIKVRYKQTAIGILWVVLQPLLTTIIFTGIFSTFARFDTANVPYPVFALSGLIVWLFVHASVTIASTSFVNNPTFVTKVYFPRLIVPVAASIAGAFDLLFSLVMLLVLMVWYWIEPTPAILLAPVFLFLGFLLSVAVGTLFSALNVRFRDVKFALPFLLQVWMITSPLFYPADLVPEKWRLLYAINPMVGIVEGFRSTLFGTPFDWTLIGVSCISLLVVLGLSLLVFAWLEDKFADVI